MFRVFWVMDYFWSSPWFAVRSRISFLYWLHASLHWWTRYHIGFSVGSMLGQRLRGWPSIGPTLTRDGVFWLVSSGNRYDPRPKKNANSGSAAPGSNAFIPEMCKAGKMRETVAQAQMLKPKRWQHLSLICWASVTNDGPTLNTHWVGVLCFHVLCWHNVSQQTQNVITQVCVNAVLMSQTVGQHQPTIGAAYSVCLDKTFSQCEHNVWPGLQTVAQYWVRIGWTSHDFRGGVVLLFPYLHHTIGPSMGQGVQLPALLISCIAD